MKKLVLKPNGWQCTLEECPAGLFVYNDSVCFKTEYKTPSGNIEAYCDSGESFWGGTCLETDRKKLIVQPVVYEWEEYDE